AGSAVAGAHRPLTSDAVSHAPLLSQCHVLVPLSTNTSQFVFTATESDVPLTGASTGSPSNTSRLAGRELKKIFGGSLLSATAGGASSCLARLSRIVSSGTRFSLIELSAVLITSSNCAACCGLADG